MSKGVAIAYKDVAPGAKENFEPTASGSKFGTLQNLKNDNMRLYNYACPCELYQTILDGSAVPFPSDPTAANIGLWSNRLSDEDGNFKFRGNIVPITLTLESEGQYSSQGITLTFDTFNDIYPRSVGIDWYRVTDGEETCLKRSVFYVYSATNFCRAAVENYNKVVISFSDLNMPNCRLKLEAIDYGYGTVFHGDELRNVQISQYLDPISSEIKISTCDFTVDSNTDMIYSFQTNQALSVRFNDRLLATMFVTSSKRTAKFLWDVHAEDYIGILDRTSFRGGLYADETVGNLLADIFAVAKIPYQVQDDIAAKTVSGYIPYTTCREALMQVCFASMAIVNTSNCNVVEIKNLENDMKQTIPLHRIKQGQNFDTVSTVTSVQITSHAYTPSDGEAEVYKAADSGVGQNILVTFSEPLHDLGIVGGEILESGVNYAIINANRESCVLGGYKYDHATSIRTKKNPKVLATETENPISLANATLVTASNVDEVLAYCYDWMIKTDSVNMKIVEGKDVERDTHTVRWGEKKYGKFEWGEWIVNETIEDQQPVNLGDMLTAKTEYMGDISGRLIQQSFNLNGNIIVKEAILK